MTRRLDAWRISSWPTWTANNSSVYAISRSVNRCAAARAFADAAAEDSTRVDFILRRREALVLDSFGTHTSVGDSLDELARILAGQITPGTEAGLFLPTDLLAAQVYPLLYQNKIVPGAGLTVATVANEYLRRPALVPEPISIDIGSEAVGRAAFERLLRRIAHPAEPAKRTLVAPSLNGQLDSSLDAHF